MNKKNKSSHYNNKKFLRMGVHLKRQKPPLEKELSKGGFIKNGVGSKRQKRR